jgi:hypothetical protein
MNDFVQFLSTCSCGNDNTKAAILPAPMAAQVGPVGKIEDYSIR